MLGDKKMPRPKKNVPVEEVIVKTAEQEETVETNPVDEKPPTQILIPFYIKQTVNMDNDDIEFEFVSDESKVDSQSESKELELDQIVKTKFEIYSHGQHIDTVEDESPELIKYLEFNRSELNQRIEELWQTPSDPNDLIFFNFGEQKLNYNSYYAYFNQNGFAPVEPKINSWMEYYLKKHNPITEEEVVIQLKGPLQYSFIPIKS